VSGGASWFREGRTVETRVDGKTVRVAGWWAGPSFGADGNLNHQPPKPFCA